ncbi:MAG: protein translocase subunit SecD [Alphaproteobacteria bacterium]|nr:protein translocase subunit SecD [Alphaproteobacteria bacterium]MCL2505068.1 protein translocase subunit SecD [Alphaproteobacteria bacterium]
MIYFSKWKIWLVIVICVSGILYSLPNVLSRQQVEWLQSNTPSFFPNQTVNLGLDLRGGSYLLLEVETQEVITEYLQSVVEQIRKTLRQERIGYTDLRLQGTKINFVSKTDNTKALEKILKEINADRTFDIEISNDKVALSMQESAIAARKRSAMEQSIETVRRRIDESGTREPSIQQQGSSRILVQLPGVDDPQRIKSLLGQTAKLSFRLVNETADPMGVISPNEEALIMAEHPGQKLVVQKRVMVAGDMLVDAQPSFQNGMPVVTFRFDSRGARWFGEATKANVGKLFAIVLDNKVISAPVIREPIMGGSGVISGSFTVEAVNDLALLLRSGALPAPINILEERTIGPGLGADSVAAGMNACLIGLGVVLISFTLLYGLFGVFANLALLINIALIFAILSILQATLTLPGMAGIILTIGMASDANILVFERIKEEMRLGRSVSASIDSGFQNALSAIIDANITTLIAALFLYIYGSGPVKGFAVTFSIGVLTSMFGALMITRLIIVMWLNRYKPKQIPL